MLSPVFIDFGGVIDEFLLTEQEVKDLSRFVLSNIKDEYKRHWEENVETHLHSTRSEYMKAMFDYQPDDYSIVFGMTPRESKLAMMLEEGATPYDIKEGFRQSDKKKRKKDGGWYLTVPFRHATSTAIAESMTFKGKMTSEIEKLVKTTERPLKLTDLPEGYRDKRVSRVGYKHKSAIFEGLHRRNIPSTDKEKRGGYFTFRRVSDKSEENSWQHPGFEPLKLMEKSLNDLQIDQVVDRSIDKFLQVKFGE